MMKSYIGRFAPSPTGPLHFGSLVAAVGSYLQARTQGGQWLLRMEDVDAPRTVPGAAEMILRQLERCGFQWDGEVLWQSTRLDAYRDVLEDLKKKGCAYPCACTRKEMTDSTLARDGSRRYPGTCRNGLLPGKLPRAWRLRTEPGDIIFFDEIQGEYCEDVFRDVGDFVLLRADGQYAYQLAVVIDDAMQGITHIVRGADLLNSTPRQIFLQRVLGYSTPHYAHLPVVTNEAGEKLSKQTLAQAFDDENPVLFLMRALTFLGLNPPVELVRMSIQEFWEWALRHWLLAHVPRVWSIAGHDFRNA